MNGSDISITENTPLFESTIAKRVIMVGGDWAKGDDLFLLVAKEVVSRDPSVHFYWLGSQSLERKTVNQGDIDKLAIASHVHFLPHTSTSHDVVKAMDVFALTSRSDSFPLAAIEAGLLGIPIVCFEKASVFNSLKYGNIDTKYRDLKLKMLRQYKKLGLIIASDWIYNKITRLHLTEDKHIFRINYSLVQKLR